jgi:hypothetical protein
MDDTVEDLVERPLRVVKQPTPELHPGGDCGACVLAGLLGLPLEEVYAQLHPQKKPASFGHSEMYHALREAKYELRLIDRYITRTPYWPADDILRALGDPSWSQSMEWREWLTMAFEAGYYALAMVRHTHEPFESRWSTCRSSVPPHRSQTLSTNHRRRFSAVQFR